MSAEEKKLYMRKKDAERKRRKRLEEKEKLSLTEEEKLTINKRGKSLEFQVKDENSRYSNNYFIHLNYQICNFINRLILNR
jgi:hypothetical protein